MKYNILINQKAFLDNGFTGILDITDLAIFDFIYDFFNCEFKGKMTFEKDGVQYVVITANLINDQMPILGNISKRTFINRMNKLIQAGLIERYEGNQKEGQSGYKKGKLFSALKFVQEKEPVKNNAEGVQQITNTSAKDCTRPLQEIADNNTYNNNNNISNNIYNREQQFYNEVMAFAGLYDNNMLIRFFDYWTEPNRSKTKLRYEMEKTWDTSRRLARWNSNNFNTNNGQAINSVSNDKQQRMQGYATTFSGMLQQVERNRQDGKFGRGTDDEELCW